MAKNKVKDLFDKLEAEMAPQAAKARTLKRNGDESYTAADIEVLEGLEPVRRRPGMYIGKLGDGSSADDFLAGICLRRARQVYGSDPDIEQRIHKELALIREGHRAGFFLRLWELLQIAHERDLPVRGRGSSANTRFRRSGAGSEISERTSAAVRRRAGNRRPEGRRRRNRSGRM